MAVVSGSREAEEQFVSQLERFVLGFKHRITALEQAPTVGPGKDLRRQFRVDIRIRRNVEHVLGAGCKYQIEKTRNVSICDTGHWVQPTW